MESLPAEKLAGVESLPAEKLAGGKACRAKTLPGLKSLPGKSLLGGNCQGQSDQKLKMGTNDYLLDGLR